VTWPEPGEDRWKDPDGDLDEGILLQWPLHWRGLHPRERWMWFEQLWDEVCVLRDRYRLPIRSGWWENELQLEALAALTAWVTRYDSGEWDDPPGKLALLYDLERVNALLKDGVDPFHPERDRSAFVRYVLELGCVPPTQSELTPPSPRFDSHTTSTNGYEPPPDDRINGAGGPGVF
jgi:hypothetical protein